MKKIKKRILSIVLTCAMMVSLLVGMAPMEVHAEDGATLTYEVVGGSGTMESKQLTVGEEFVLPAPSFTPDDGREFYGWFVYDSADDRELEVCGYEAPEFTPKGEYTYTAIACYGYPVTVKNLPEGTNITYMSTSISNPSALVIPEAGERISEEANCFIIQNSSMTSAPIFTGENGKAELVSSDDGTYIYVVRDITGPVTLTLTDAPNPPAQTTTLTYEVVGGTGTMEQATLTVGEEFVLPSPEFTPDDGREFYGWFVYDSADDRELEVCGYEAPEFTPKGEYTYTAIACYGYPVTVKNLPEGTNITYMSTSISNPSALVIPEAGERISEEANCFIIQNSSMTSAPIFTGENGKAELVSSNDGEYYYVVRDITGPVTLVASSNPPATDTYTITLDRTNYADGYVELYTYNSEGNNVANTQDNNATIAMPEGGKVRVFADSEFTVTATGATVGEMQAAGEEGYYYELTGIAADTTVVVNKVTIPVVTAPIITGQPQNVSVQEGQKATFSVTATGDNLSYQWQIDRNDGNGFVNLSGATSASYITSTVDMDCNGFKYQCIVSNEGGSVTTNIATLTVTESTSVHTHSLTLVPAKVATCTETGNKAYYTCSGCDSLFTDANGTTTTTAEAVKIAALGHDWTGEWTITKEATATEEGKKETLCERDDCGQKKVVIIPITGTTDDNANLEKDAEVEPEAPIDEATLNNSKEELLGAGNIFEDAEKAQIENGTDARVWLEVTKTDESAIASTDKAKIEQEATQIMGDNLVITYFDADLFKQVGTNERTPVPEPGIAIKITITIPDELLNSDGTISREYQIIRLHEGQVDVISGTFDSATGEFTFESDKFSTYAIVYKDVPVNDNPNPTPAPGGENPTPVPGGENPTPAPGGENPTPAPGGENPTPAPGGENPTPAPGGENPTPVPGGGENPTPAPGGGENPTPAPSNNDVVNSGENKLDEVPKTGESNVTLYFFILMLLSGAGVVICSRIKKNSNKES